MLPTAERSAQQLSLSSHLPIVVLLKLVGDIFEPCPILDHNWSTSNLDQAIALPHPQALIHAFPSSADHTRELALAETHVGIGPVALRLAMHDPQHRPCKSHGQVFHCDFGNKLICATQSLRQYFDQLGPSAWMSFEKWQDVTPFKIRQRAWAVSDRVGGSGFAVQYSKLSENLALWQDCEQQLLSVGRGYADPHHSTEYCYHIVPRWPSREDHVTWLEGADVGARRNCIALLSPKSAK
jgi:hypothetical protein